MKVNPSVDGPRRSIEAARGYAMGKTTRDELEAAHYDAQLSISSAYYQRTNSREHEAAYAAACAASDASHLELSFGALATVDSCVLTAISANGVSEATGKDNGERAWQLEELKRRLKEEQG